MFKTQGATMWPLAAWRPPLCLSTCGGSAGSACRHRNRMMRAPVENKTKRQTTGGSKSVGVEKKG